MRRYDHSYHEFCNPRSVFSRLERAGLMDHRIADRIGPGEEHEPFVPETNTRATTRARFIRDHADARNLIADWSCVQDIAGNRLKWLCDPFAKKFDDWIQGSPRPSRLERLRDMLQ